MTILLTGCENGKYAAISPRDEMRHAEYRRERQIMTR